MMNPTTLRTVLFGLLVAEVCVISVSIAAGSMLLALIILCLILLVVRERSFPSAGRMLDIALLGYAAAEFLSAAFSAQTMAALRNSKRLLLVAIVYSVLTSFTTKDRVKNALQWLAGSVAVLSIFEIIVMFHDGIARLFVFQHYMTTGGLKMIVSLLLIPFLLTKEVPKKERWFWIVSFIPTFIALILTNTRSAWLGLVVGVIVMSILQYRKLFFILAAGIVAFFLFAPASQVDRARSIVDITHHSNAGRLNMWSTGLRMWQDRPLVGFGDIDLYDTYLTYRTPTGDEPAGHLHNNYIHLLVTLGVIGLAAAGFLFFTIIRQELSALRALQSDPFLRDIALGTLAVFAGFLINGLFEWNFGDHEIMVFVWFTVGLSRAAYTLQEQA